MDLSTRTSSFIFNCLYKRNILSNDHIDHNYILFNVFDENCIVFRASLGKYLPRKSKNICLLCSGSKYVDNLYG